MSAREVRADGRTVAVREWGPPDGMPLLFWHALGLGSSGTTFAVAAEPLARAGFRVLAIDAPGFGIVWCSSCARKVSTRRGRWTRGARRRRSARTAP